MSKCEICERSIEGKYKYCHQCSNSFLFSLKVRLGVIGASEVEPSPEILKQSEYIVKNFPSFLVRVAIYCLILYFLLTLVSSNQ